MDPMMRAAIQEAATEAASKAVDDVLVRLGIDAQRPIETQRDMAVVREMRRMLTDPEFQKDLAHLRKWRKAVNSVETKGVLTIVTILTTSALGLLYVGLRSVFGKGA